MRKLGSHIRRNIHTALVLLIAFALAPCGVKETWFSAVGLDYAKPLNKSRTATGGQQCLLTTVSATVATASKEERRRKHDITTDGRNERDHDHFVVKSPIPATTASSGNDPPRYILYKRLKLDLA